MKCNDCGWLGRLWQLDVVTHDNDVETDACPECFSSAVFNDEADQPDDEPADL